MQDKLKETRKRLRDDFSFYAKNALKIRTKAGEVHPLILNPVQQRLQEVVEPLELACSRPCLALEFGRERRAPPELENLMPETCT